ncbi:PAS domain S-box protein [Nocardioides pacificus]
MHERLADDGSLFRGIVEAAPDAMVVVDRTGTIVLVNAQTEKIFGYARGELLGQRIEILVPRRAHEVHKEHRAAYVEHPDVRPMGITEELSAVRRDGSEFPVEISLAPVESSQGLLISAAVRDITERKRVEGRFRNLLEAAPDAMVIVDDTATIVHVNRQVERVFGYRRDELVGQEIEVLIPERQRRGHLARRNGFLMTEPGARPMANGLELTGRRKDGTEFPAEISLSPLDTEEGVLVSAAVRDMSDRQHLQEEHNRMREQVIATVSHELRTPLTSILGYAELMEDLGDDEVGPGARRLLGIISRNAARELQLVEDLLTLAFIGEQRMTIRPVPTDLRDVAREALAANQDQAAEAGIELVLADEELVPVLGEAHRLRQVVDHLIGNALKFTSAGGRIEVRVRDSGSMAVLEVEDTGMGVPAEELPRVFERLYRASGAVAAQIPGAGLGLPITKAIVEAHAGWIDVESEQGVGTVFRVALPYAEQRVRDGA